MWFCTWEHSDEGTSSMCVKYLGPPPPSTRTLWYYQGLPRYGNGELRLGCSIWTITHLTTGRGLRWMTYIHGTLQMVSLPPPPLLFWLSVLESYSRPCHTYMLRITYVPVSGVLSNLYLVFLLPKLFTSWDFETPESSIGSTLSSSYTVAAPTDTVNIGSVEGFTYPKLFCTCVPLPIYIRLRFTRDLIHQD